MPTSRSVKTLIVGLLFIHTIFGCSEPVQEPERTTAPATETPMAIADEISCDNQSELGMPLFGDLHVHTSLSFDAAANSTGATPEDANRYAKGEPIASFPLDDEGNAIGEVKIDRPLDFLAVTDHGEFLGERALCRTPGSQVYDSAFCQGYRSNERQGMMMLGTVITTETPARIPAVCGEDGSRCVESAMGPWQSLQDAANNANTPCKFTSFVAYEYTGTPGTSNYHRNVIFRNDNVPAAPVSYIDAPIDSKLWSELDAVCDINDGCDYLTIPHNTNLANGRMAPYMQLEDTTAAKQAYASKRLEREPIMEIFQHKGGSECVNGLTSVLGAPDELCAVEAVRRMGENKSYLRRELGAEGLQTEQASEVTRECEPGEIGANGMLGAGCVDATDFQRSALVVGLKEEQSIGLNPIKLGVIAATDTHSATPGNVKEDAWTGAVTGESDAASRLEPGLLTSGIDGNPGGLAGVWAKENTRDAIFDAMLRREVFGTSGPRIVPRLFASWNFPSDLCENSDRDNVGYATGVPMGGDLLPNERGTTANKPTFLAHAAQDPQGLALQKLQLIKGWVAQDGSMHTEVLPIAESDQGAATLCTVYTDESFDAAQSAYYYLRVVEPATPRWHTYDCAELADEAKPEVCTNGQYPDTVQEMAWTSPIWYRGQ